jgi:hypothetical protein
MTFGGFPAKCLMLPIYATVEKRMLAQEPQVDTFRFGRKLSLTSTIAIKHQVRMLMADDRAKKAEEEARAQSADIPQMKVGLERLTT